MEYRIKYTNIKHKLKSVVEMNLRCHCLLIPVICDLMVKTCCPGDRLFSVASPPKGLELSATLHLVDKEKLYSLGYVTRLVHNTLGKEK